MAQNEERLCRLCLKETKSNCLAIEGITREMLEAVLQKIDLSLSKDPVMCTICVHRVRDCFEFKSMCSRTEERVTASTNGLDSTKVDVVEVAYLSDNHNEQAVSDSDHSICRLCMKRVYCIALDLLDEDFIMKMVPKCIPQINLRVTARPMICAVCVESLNDYFHFMSSCYDTEEKISEHLKFQGAEWGKVDLHSIHRIPVKNDPYYNVKCENDKVKSEFEDVHSSGYPVKLEDELIIKNGDEVVEFKEEGNRLIEEWLEETGFEVIRNPSDKKHYKCKRCPYKTKYRHILKRHSSNHAHPSQLPKLKCLLCSYEARREYSLKRHMKEHNSSATIYKCELCTFSTLNKTTFNSHQLAHKEPSQTELFKCDKCTFVTKYKNNLKYHALTHLDLVHRQTFQCSSCSYMAKSITGLKYHTKMHDPSTTVHNCKLCNYSTVNKHLFKRHLLLHTDPSKLVLFKCEKCTYATKYKGNLTSHSRIHTKHSMGASNTT